MRRHLLKLVHYFYTILYFLSNCTDLALHFADCVVCNELVSVRYLPSTHAKGVDSVGEQGEASESAHQWNLLGCEWIVTH